MFDCPRSPANPPTAPVMFRGTSSQTFNNSSFVNAAGNHVVFNLSLALDTPDPTPSNGQSKSPWFRVKRLVSGLHHPSRRIAAEDSVILGVDEDAAGTDSGPPSSRSARSFSDAGQEPRPLLKEGKCEHGCTGPSTSSHVCSTVDIQDQVLDYSHGIDMTTLSSLEPFQRRRHLNLPKTYAQVYVEKMYTMGHGFPCYNPHPFGSPVQIGDVGFLGDEGFRAIFNIYDPPHEFLQKCGVPDTPKITRQQKFPEGDTLTPNIANTEVEYSSDEKSILHYRFRCDESEGAILVVPSAAELEEIENNTALCDFLCQNAPKLYHFARIRQRLEPGEPLYVVTGLIKTDNWAIAAHRDSMTKPYNTLTLRNRGIIRPNDIGPTYSWTRKGNAEARHGQSTANSGGIWTKDQCLFHRGFLLTPSSEFLAKPKPSWNYENDSQGDDVSGPEHYEEEGWNGKDTRQSNNARDRNPDPKEGGSSSKSSSSSSTQEGLEGLEGVISIRDYPVSGIKAHESLSWLNNALLEGTNAHFAITHDDDWSPVLKETLASDGETAAYLSIKMLEPEHVNSDSLTPRLVFATARERQAFQDSLNECTVMTEKHRPPVTGPILWEQDKEAPDLVIGTGTTHHPRSRRHKSLPAMLNLPPPEDQFQGPAGNDGSPPPSVTHGGPESDSKGGNTTDATKRVKRDKFTCFAYPQNYKIKTHICRICNRTFATQSILTRHSMRCEVIDHQNAVSSQIPESS